MIWLLRCEFQNVLKSLKRQEETELSNFTAQEGPAVTWSITKLIVLVFHNYTPLKGNKILQTKTISTYMQIFQMTPIYECVYYRDCWMYYQKIKCLQSSSIVVYIYQVRNMANISVYSRFKVQICHYIIQDCTVKCSFSLFHTAHVENVYINIKIFSIRKE